MSVVVRIENLSKEYRLGILDRRAFFKDLRAKLSGHGKDPKPESFWALKDISFDVRDGEVDGLADFYRKLWQNPAGSEIPLRVVRDGRETWLRVKSADRNSFLKKPQLQ